MGRLTRVAPRSIATLVDVGVWALDPLDPHVQGYLDDTLRSIIGHGFCAGKTQHSNLLNERPVILIEPMFLCDY